MKSRCLLGVPQECADGPLNPQQLLRLHGRARVLEACAHRESSRGGFPLRCVRARVCVCGLKGSLSHKDGQVAVEELKPENLCVCLCACLHDHFCCLYFLILYYFN